MVGLLGYCREELRTEKVPIQVDSKLVEKDIMSTGKSKWLLVHPDSVHLVLRNKDKGSHLGVDASAGAV